MSTPKKLIAQLQAREQQGILRTLPNASHLIDFSSNDYLSLAQVSFDVDPTTKHGATGSRLLSGNHEYYAPVETQIAQFHQVPSALIFNSGYAANLGVLQAVPQRGDIILYDELSHASMRQGLQLSLAKSVKFKHNDLAHVEQLLCNITPKENQDIYILTESVFSMDGDSPDIQRLVALSKKYKAHLIIDEAHALGVAGKKGEGLVQKFGLENEVFARIVTFGKAMGCHGAAVLGSQELTQYLVNFARSFIYTTALPSAAVSHIGQVYSHVDQHPELVYALYENVVHFGNSVTKHQLTSIFQLNYSAIQLAMISGNDRCIAASNYLIQNGYDVRPILSPTVPAGTERLRFCIHTHNSPDQIDSVIEHLALFLQREKSL